MLCTHKTTILCQFCLSCHQLTTISPSIPNHFWWELYHGYLSFIPDGAIRFRTGEPDFSSLKDQEYDWTRSVYSGACEQIPHDIPKPLGKHVQTDRIPSNTPGAEPPRDARDSGSARSHSMHLETSSSDRP